MKEIIVNSDTYGMRIILVDDDDYEWLNQWKWNVRYQKKNDSFYAMRTIILSNGKYHGEFAFINQL